MITKAIFRRAAVLVIFSWAARASAVDINAGVTLTGGAIGPINVEVAVSTFPLKDPAQALDPAFIIASTQVFVLSTTGGHLFSGLPFFGAPTNYYVYGFIDGNFDSVPGSTEAMGGFGPFPFNELAASANAFSTGDTLGVSLAVFPRGEITGSLVNASFQSGDRLIVRAIDFGQPPHFWQIVELPVGGGPFPYSLGGLKPGLNYTVEAWVDTQPEGQAGAFNPDPFEDKALPQGPFLAAGGATDPGVNLLISSGAVGGSTPDHIRLEGPNGTGSQVIESNAPSSDLRISVRDFNDIFTSTQTDADVLFTAYDSGGPVSVDISTDGFVSTTTVITISSGTTFSPPFKFRYAGTGFVLLEGRALNFPDSGDIRSAFFSFNVLPPGAAFANVNARTTSDPTAATGTAVSISPDGDGVNDGVVLTADPPDPNVFWELAVSTDTGFSTGVVRRFFGTGPAQMFWHGDGEDGRVVPNGVYFARFHTEGEGIVSSTLSVTVNTAFIKGIVEDALTNLLPGANAQAFGPGGGGFAQADPNGQFFIGGLNAGQSYNLEIFYPGKEPGNFVVTASSDMGTVALRDGAALHIQVTVSSAASQDLYGQVFAHDATYVSAANGPLHLGPGSLTTDNGQPAGGTGFSTYTVLNVLPGVDYTVEVELPYYGHLATTITAPPAGFAVDVLIPVMTRKANITGVVNFPAPLDSPFGGEFISVDALLCGTCAPVAWGGGFVNDGAASGSYELLGVDPGTYTLRAFARGYVQSSTSPIEMLFSDLSGVDFPAFSLGGTVTGTVTINGDTSGLAFGGFGGSACGPGEAGFPINANSPSSFANAFTLVCFSTGPGPVTQSTYSLTGLPDGAYNIFAFLPGFEISPHGLLQTSVAGGVGNLDFALSAFTGRVNISANLPDIDVPAAVLYKLERDGPDPDERVGNLSGPVGGPGAGSVMGLGTGLYTLKLHDENPGRGLQRLVAVSVTNGSTTTVSVDMDIPTFYVAGSVALQGNVILPSTWSVTVSSMAGLAATDITPEIQVFAFPLPERFDDRTLPLRKFTVTPHPSSGTFLLTDLTPGGYLFRVKEDLNPPSPDCPGCPTQPGKPEMASSDRVVFIGTAGVTGVDLTLTNGARLSGTVRRPVGDPSTDPRHFNLRLRRNDNLSVWQTDVDTSGAGTASYNFPHLAAGAYILEVYEDSLPVKYAAPAESVEIGNGDVTLNIDLVAAGTMVGRLRDADSDTLINAQNAGLFLPDRFEIFAQANPWVPGGFAQAEKNAAGGGFGFDPNTGQFTITRLIPDTTYDATFRGFAELGLESRAHGQRTYAPTVVGGVRLAAGQVIDLGTIDLKQGGILSGTIQTAEGAPLPNARVQAVPSLSNGPDRHNFSVEGFTDGAGRYELHGVDRGRNYYDVIAAPRFPSGDIFGQLAGPKYGEERLRMVDVNDTAATTGLDFTLTPAPGVLIGKIMTSDAGDLVPAFSGGNNQAGVRGANIVLHFDGAPLDDNPLGEIKDITGPDGTFRVNALKPGNYTFYAIAVGYATALRKIAVSASGQTNMGTVTLNSGATVSGTLTKSDGAPPSAADIKMVMAVDANFEDFVFGRVDANAETQLVTGYSLAGFRAGKDYSLVIVTPKDEVIEAETGVTFSSATESRVIDLVFRPSGPKVFVNQSRSGNTYTLEFFSSQPLRNLTADDNDLGLIVTLSTGAGAITGVELSPSRDALTVVYDATPVETAFALQLTFNTIEVDPDSATGDNYLFDRTIEFFAGIGLRRSVGIPNVTGGDCTLEGVATGVTFDSGSFDVDRSSSVDVGIQSASLLSDLPAGAPAPAPRARASLMALAAERLGPSAFPNAGLFKAVTAAPTVSPFSAFYDIFLPAGVNHMLKREALLTLKYDDSVADPAGLNVYHFDPNNNLFLLEKNQRAVDTVNKTVTVAVSHLSTFVVLQSQAPIVGTSDFTGTEIIVFNAPNPFNLKPKTVSLTHSSPPQDQTTTGTVIRYALPAGKSGSVAIEIYDVSGVLVRILTQSAPTGGTYYYTDWDGKNEGGDKVASGVYVARFTLNGNDEKFFKMAVLK